MDKELRASLAAAGVAAALSAIVGLLAGVGFLSLLLRALAFGVVAAGATYGAAALLRSFVPGLLDPGEVPAAEEAPEAGTRVDIVLPAEEPASAERLAEAEAGPAGPERAAEPAPFAEDGSGEYAELEAANLLEPEANEAEPIAALPPNAAPDREGRPSAGFDELDILPDLDGFADTFTASEFASGGAAHETSDRGLDRQSQLGRASGGASAGAEGMDPATLAQAVRTILKRDQKG